MPVIQRRLLIGGRVQGVFFRQSTRDRARQLNLSGWIRNRHDGRVEAVFQGVPEAVEQMLRWCKAGPPGARVTTTEVFEEDPGLSLPGFSIRPTE